MNKNTIMNKNIDLDYTIGEYIVHKSLIWEILNIKNKENMPSLLCECREVDNHLISWINANDVESKYDIKQLCFEL